MLTFYLCDCFLLILVLVQVTCDPDITIHQRTPSDDVLILGCDGVWDVMSSQDCVELAREILAGGESNMQLVAEEIVDTSMNKGIARTSECISCMPSYFISSPP